MQGRIELPPRLEMIARYIPAGESVVDIGTDHAYLPIYVIQSGRCERAVAADVRPGPLTIARSHVERMGLTDRIELRLSDGLDSFVPQELSCVVMAGMGGYLIAELLNRAYESGKLTRYKRLILQPQSEVFRVRQTVHRIGGRICEERMVEDRGKVYTIIVVQPGTEVYEAHEYEYGRKLFEARDPVFYQVLKEETDQKRVILASLRARQEETERTHARAEQLERQILLGERMISKWAER